VNISFSARVVLRALNEDELPIPYSFFPFNSGSAFVVGGGITSLIGPVVTIGMPGVETPWRIQGDRLVQ
jgi:hypothetical protein